MGRETPAITVTHMLMEDGANVFVYDPKVRKEDALYEFKTHGMEVEESRLVFTDTAMDAIDGAHAIVVLTEWDEFKTYDYTSFYKKMMKPAFFFDGRNLVDHAALTSIGFEVHSIGKPSAKSRQKMTEREGSFSLREN